MLKILQASFQQYVNQELPDVQTVSKRQRNQRSNCQHSLDWGEFQKNISFFIDYTKAFDYVDHNKLWEILKVMGLDALILFF